MFPFGINHAGIKMIQGDLFGPPAAPAGDAAAGDGPKRVRALPAHPPPPLMDEAEQTGEQAGGGDREAIGRQSIEDRQAIDDQRQDAPPADNQQAGKPQPGAISSPADLGRLVRAARKRRGVAQQVFADAAGVGRRFLSELENGKPTLELGKVLTVASAAGIVIFAGER
jgi:y4mF family transcriptional regulator